MISAELLHYSSAGLSILLGSLGAGIGLGIAGMSVQKSMIRQPTGNAQTFRTMIIGLALIESGAIVALVATLLTLLGRSQAITYELALAELGISLAIGFAAASICIASSFVVYAACQAISRQPLFAPKITTFMLIAQSIIEAPVIFAFIIALLIRNQITPTIDIHDSLKFFASSMVIALGCIGPSIGQAIFSYAACTSIGINYKVYNKLFPFALLNQAVIETPMIFCLLLSMVMLYTPLDPTTPYITIVKFLTAAFTMGVGAFGTSIGIGYVASRSCYQIAYEPGVYAVIARATLLAVAFIESSVIYALIVAMLLINI